MTAISRPILISLVSAHYFLIIVFFQASGSFGFFRELRFDVSAVIKKCFSTIDNNFLLFFFSSLGVTTDFFAFALVHSRFFGFTHVLAMALHFLV